MEDKRIKRQNIYKIIMLVILTATITFMLTTMIMYNKFVTSYGSMGIKTNTDGTSSISTTDLVKTLETFKTMIKQKYIGEVDEEKMVEGAIKGFVEGLGDPYTEYLPKEEMTEFTEETSSQYVGIGIYLTNDKTTNTILVVGTMNGSPAMEAGMQAGDIIEKVNDEKYIDTLINKYWFLTNDIKNKNIYYPLEGYLFPDTYNVMKDTDIKDIITKMLDETDNKLSKYKDSITNNKLSIHEIITLASVVELEVANKDDRKSVAGIFLNRLDSKYFPTLGSDATSYYGAKIDDWSTNRLTSVELNDCSNKYNTRCAYNKGLPVGPIGNPSIESIEAVLNPEKHNYYYFVNDCKGKLYMSKNETEHNNIINKLKKENNWCA